MAHAALDLVVCPTNAPGDPITLIAGDGEPNVIVDGWFVGLCRTQMSYRLKLCIEMVGGSDNAFHQQKCDAKEATDHHAWDFINKRIDLLCRPGTQYYRLVAEVSWPSALNRIIPILGDDHWEKHKSLGYQLNCNEAGAWRFKASHEMGFIDLPARRISAEEQLGFSLREPGQDQDLPDGLPSDRARKGGWAAHHIVAAGRGSRSRAIQDDVAEAQRVAFDCRLSPNQAVNGVWLRGKDLREGTPGYLALERNARQRAYHPTLHTAKYFRSVRQILEPLATRDNRCTDRSDAILDLRLITVELRLDRFPH